MPRLIRMIDFFAIGKMPWIVRAYGFLFLILVIIAALSSTKLPQQQELFDLVSDAMKVVLGALLGVLSLAANQSGFSGKGDSSDAGSHTSLASS